MATDLWNLHVKTTVTIWQANKAKEIVLYNTDIRANNERNRRIRVGAVGK